MDENRPQTPPEQNKDGSEQPSTAPETQPEPSSSPELATIKPEPEQDKPPVVNAPSVSPTPFVAPGRKRAHRRVWLLVVVAVVVLAGATGFGWWLGHRSPSTKVGASENASTQTQTQPTNQTQTSTTAASAQGMQLDTSKNYGNKYADGILPVGDGKYTTSGPKQGYGYVCSSYAQTFTRQAGGAGRPGPWFTNNDTQYNINKKAQVEGSVSWQGSLNNTVSGSTRTITTNDLPINATTGIFPIKRSDPAYAYDKNPNTITAQSFTYSLAADPTYNATPHCIGGQVGVMLNGVALFSAFDAAGRDAGAWETQDSCDGHPQSNGIYHYHTLSSCIKNVSVHNVIGFALDGFPITGPDIGTNNVLTTSDLDACHGITSQITLDGKSVTMYHYVMTQDFPYSISCYHGTPITPPGQAEHLASHP